MKFLIAVSTFIVAIAAAQTNTSASVTPATNSSSVPNSSKAPAVSPSLEVVTPVPSGLAAPVVATPVSGETLAPVVLVSVSPFIPPVSLAPFASEPPVVVEPTTEAPSKSPNTAAPATKPPNPGSPSCNVCGGSFVMETPDEKVSSGLFGDVSCSYVYELGQEGFFTADQCDAIASIVAEPCQCKAPDTEAPNTDAPVTSAPDTDAPVTSAPYTNATVTSAPNTNATVTSANGTTSTNSPVSNANSTNAPVTKAPKTSASVMTGIDGAIVAAVLLLSAVLN